MKLRNRINRKYLQISIYVIITVMIIYTLSLVVKNAPAILATGISGLRWLLRVIKPVILGFIFAYLMDPVVGFFECRYKQLKNVRLFRRIVMPRTWGAITSVILLIIAFLGLVSLLVFTITDQLRLVSLDDIIKLGEGFISSFQEFTNMLLAKLNDLNIESKELQQYIENASSFIANSLVNVVKGSVTSISNVSNTLTTLIFGFIIGIYFMIDGRMFMNYLKKISKALFGKHTNLRLKRMVDDLDEVFSGYIRGQLIDAFVMMILISIILSITGVKFAIVIGILAGVGNLIPYFGPIVAYVGTTLVCLIRGDFKTFLISMIALFVIQFIDGNMIGPKLLSNAIKIHPLIVIVSIIFGSALGGFLGMLLAVPVGAYIKLIFVRFIDHRLKRKEEMERRERI
jgi:predicted PurR-regulated permease PerM